MVKARIDWMGGGRVKLNGTVYDATEIRTKSEGQSVVVWPLNLSYELVESTLAVVYSSGNQINARATNYAYITGRVITKRGETVIDDSTKTLTPLAWSNTNFFKRITEGETLTNNVTGVDHDPINYPGYGMANREFPQGIDCTISQVSYADKTFNIAEANRPTIHQQSNTATATGTTDITTAYEFYLSTTQFYHTGGTVTVSGTQTYNVQTAYLWTSEATSTAITSIGDTRSHLPDTLLVSPTPQEITDDKQYIKLAANNTSSNITYQVTASLDGKVGTAKNVTVLATVYNYRNLEVYQYSYSDLPAKGGSAYPAYLLLRMQYSIDGVWQSGYLSGSPSNGSTSARLSSSNHSVYVSVSYRRKSGNYWVSDTDYGKVTATSREDNEDTTHTTATVSYPNRRVIVSYGSLSDSEDVTVYQAANTKSEKSRALKSYSVLISKTDGGSGASSIASFDQAGGYIYFVGGQAKYDVTYSWASEWPDTTGELTVSQNPTSATTDPNVGSSNIEIANHRIKIPANMTDQQKPYTIVGKFTYGGVTKEAEDCTVTQVGIAYTYGIPQIVSFWYDEIPASGGEVFPNITFSQSRTWSGGTADPVTGSVSGGATSGTASDGTQFTITGFTGSGENTGTLNTSTGRVYIGSRGTERQENPTDRNAASNIKVTVKCHNVPGTNANGIAAVQEANTYTITEAFTTCNTLNITFSPSELLSAGPTIVSIIAKATGYDTAKRWDYKSGDHDGGEVTNYTNRTVTLDKLTVNSSTQSDTTQFTADNSHRTSTRTYNIVGTYGANKKTGSASITQAADFQSDFLYRNYIVTLNTTSNSISASGGSIYVVATGTCTKYKKWMNSDGADVSGSVSSGVKAVPDITLANMSETGIFSKRNEGSNAATGQRYCWVDHRDMTNNVTTDSVTITATAGDVSQTYPISVQNSRSYGVITLTATSGTSVPAYGTTLSFTATCPISYTSGHSGDSLSTSNFTYSVTKGNNTFRDYTVSYNSTTGKEEVVFGPIKAEERSQVTSTLTASHAGTSDASITITEAENAITGQSLSVTWNITGTPISGSGGTARVRITSAKVYTNYTSLESSEETASAALLLKRTTSNQSWLTYSHSGNNDYATVTASANPSTTSYRDATLTATYATGVTATTSIRQSKKATSNFSISINSLNVTVGAGRLTVVSDISYYSSNSLTARSVYLRIYTFNDGDTSDTLLSGFTHGESSISLPSELTTWAAAHGGEGLGNEYINKTVITSFKSYITAVLTYTVEGNTYTDTRTVPIVI